MAEHTWRPHDPREPIPGERDPSTLTKREPGAVSGQFSGADIPPAEHLDWLDDDTVHEHELEGGGKKKGAE